MSQVGVQTKKFPLAALAALYINLYFAATKPRLDRWGDTATLVVLSTYHSTLGDQAFPVASARA